MLCVMSLQLVEQVRWSRVEVVWVGEVESQATGLHRRVCGGAEGRAREKPPYKALRKAMINV